MEQYVRPARQLDRAAKNVRTDELNVPPRRIWTGPRKRRVERIHLHVELVGRGVHLRGEARAQVVGQCGEVRVAIAMGSIAEIECIEQRESKQTRKEERADRRRDAVEAVVALARM